MATATKRPGSGGMTRRRGRPSTKAENDMGMDGPVRSLTRALTLLETVASHPHGISLGDLAERAELAPSTAHRLLKGLELRRFIRQDEERGLWFVGVQAFFVGTAFLHERDFVAIARPFMRQAMERGGESVNLAVRDGSDAIYLSQVECRQMMRSQATPGGRAPLHASAVGKALLSGLNWRQAERLLARLDLYKLTDRTLTNVDMVQDNLDEARRQGYAVDDEEHAVGLRCVAAPVFNEYGEPLAAISISGPSARIDDARLAELGRLMTETTRAVTGELGGQIPPGFSAE